MDEWCEIRIGPSPVLGLEREKENGENRGKGVYTVADPGEGGILTQKTPLPPSKQGFITWASLRVNFTISEESTRDKCPLGEITFSTIQSSI